MNKIASDILKVAKAITRTEMTFIRSPKAEDNKFNAIHYEISRFLDTVRRNENLDTFINRTDDDKEMKLEVGISDHESIDAVVREILALANKVSGKNDIEMKE